MSVDMSNRARPATSADVARLAGVSRATVSYILNAAPGVKFSESTRAAVLRAAEELDYRPNVAARSLAAGNGVLVIVIPRLPQSEFTARIGELLFVRLAQRGILCTLVNESLDIDVFVRTIATFRPRAAVFLSTPGTAIAERLEQAGIPVLRPLANPDASVSIGGRQVQHLIDRHRRALAFASVEAGADQTSARQREIEQACAVAGIASPAVGGFRLDGIGAAQTIREWREQGIDGVCAFNDDIALAVLFGIRKAGLSCPGDVAVIGTDGIAAGAVAYPPLTTIAIDPDPAAEWFVAAVLGKLAIEHDAPAPVDTILQLVVRDST